MSDGMHQDADLALLAALVVEHGPSGFINSREGWIECLCDARLPLPGGFDSDGYPMDADAEDITRAAHLAHAILASDWLAERDARVRAEALLEAADAIRTNDAVRLGHNVSVVCRCLRCEVAEAAERVVRACAARTYTPDQHQADR